MPTRRSILEGLAAGAALVAAPALAAPETDPKLDAAVANALRKLYAGSSAARLMREKAHAVLVFPSIIKAGFLVGGAFGEGELLERGRHAGYYRSVAGSYGFQAGFKSFGYALFFMSERARAYLDRSDGWEVSAGPSLVVVDSGFAHTVTAATLTQDTYAFVFNQQGLMGGAGIEGSKITRIG